MLGNMYMLCSPMSSLELIMCMAGNLGYARLGREQHDPKKKKKKIGTDGLPGLDYT